MRRSTCTDKLIRMVHTLRYRPELFPARVTALYVFGSYARGALEPNDLDVILVHDAFPNSYFESLQRRFNYSLYQTVRRGWEAAHLEMRRALRRRGERIDILLCRHLSDVVGGRIPRRDVKLIWYRHDEAWQVRMNAIAPDPRASCAPRQQLLNLRRTSDGVDAMEQVMSYLEKDFLQLERIDAEELAGLPRGDRQQRSGLGRRSQRLLPLALWWWQQQQQLHAPRAASRCELRSPTHRVHFGRVSLMRMVELFDNDPLLKRQCLIPHWRSGEDNQLLVFQRGDNWAARS